MGRKKKRKRDSVEATESTKPDTNAPSVNPPETADQPESAQASLTPSAGTQTLERISSKSRMTRMFSFLVLLGIVALISVLSYKVLHTFIMPLFVAALLVVIFGPAHDFIRDICGNRRSIAAGLTTAAILLIVLAPIAWAVSIGVRQGIELANRGFGNSDSILNLRKIPAKIGWEVPSKLSDDLEDLDAQISSMQLSEGDDPAKLLNEKQNLLKRAEAKLKSFDANMDTCLATERAKDKPSTSLIKRIESTKQELVTLQEQLLGEEGSVQSKLNTMNDAADATSQAALDEYQALVESAILYYRKTRQELHGGVMLAPIIELVNPSEEKLRSWQSFVMSKLSEIMLNITGQTTSIMGGLMMQLFILTMAIYYFLLDGAEMVRAAMELSPIDDAYEEEMISEFSKLSRAVVLATLLTAIAQGVLAGIGYACVWGSDSLFMLVILTTIAAMIPFFGAGLIWVPVCIHLAFVEQRFPAAIGLGLYGFFIISMADNIIKPWVLKGQSNLHPLFALLSVLGGVQALGPIGVLVGPMIVAFLQSLLNILHRDLKRMDELRSEAA